MPWRPNPFVRNALSADIGEDFIARETRTFIENYNVNRVRPKAIGSAWKIHINRAWRKKQGDPYALFLRTLKFKSLEILARKQWGVNTSEIKTSEELIQKILNQKTKQEHQSTRRGTR